MFPFRQDSWDNPLSKLKLSNLVSNSSEVDKSRLLATSAPHASDWLNAIPIPSLGLKMNKTQLRIACSLRLGSPLCHPHTCICGTMVEKNGVHGLSCKKSAGRFARHSQVNDLIKRALSGAHIPAVLEPSGVSREDGKRPDGMTIFPWKSGKSMVWNYTCSDTLAPSHLGTSSLAPGKVEEAAENAKLIKYANLHDEYDVIPIHVETMGPWGPSGLKFIKEVGKKIQSETGETRSVEFLLQAIGMAVQRGNSASVMGTVANSRSLDEIYYLV